MKRNLAIAVTLLMLAGSATAFALPGGFFYVADAEIILQFIRNRRKSAWQSRIAAAQVQTGSSLSAPTNIRPSEPVVASANCRARNLLLTSGAIRFKNCAIKRCCGECGGFARSAALPDLPPRVRSATGCAPARKKKLVTSQ